MPSLASCCTSKGATDACTPYQRLHRAAPATSCSDNNNINGRSNRFLCCIDAASSRSDRFAIGAINNIDLQLNQSDCNAATSPSHSCNGIKAHRNVGLHSNRSDCDDAGGVRRSRHSDNCTILNISTSTELKAKDGIVAAFDDDANTVLVKIGIVGDGETGKTSFMAKYGGMQVKHEGEGVTLLQKVCKLHHVNIALHIWDFGVAMCQQVDYGLQRC